MPLETISAIQALNRAMSQAYTALQSGDKREARHWAQIAASMAPTSEEPWLILAAASTARASIAYLKRALEINPQSERARGGLEWATRRLAETAKPSDRKDEGAALQAEPPAVKKRLSFINSATRLGPATKIFIPIVVLTLALLLIVAWTFRPGKGSPAANLRNNATFSQNGALPTNSPVDPGPQTNAPLPTETNPPAASPSPTAFQPVAATPTPEYATELVSGLLEGEFFAAHLPVEGEKLITVSLQEQRLYAYQDGRLVANFIVSTGGRSNTLIGSFHILDKIPNAYSDIWNFWMPNWMGIYFAGSLENGFHALPVMPNGETIWSNALGTPASYGCIVLGAQEAQALYDWAEVGTSVQINP
jgi:hypothetical protein